MPMRTPALSIMPFVLAGAAFAQMPGLTLPPSGNSQRAAVVQFIGPVEVKVEYSSPAVHSQDGKDRRGEIWGKLVPYGMSDLGFNKGKKSPWRAGANQNTVFSVSHPVTIEGKSLPAGRYGVHMIPGQEEWTLIFSKNDKAWGSYTYDEADDALRVTVKPKKREYREWLAYDFTARRPNEATVEMHWEELAVPWTVTVPNVNEIYISRLKQDLTGAHAFNAKAYVEAARFCVDSNANLEQGLAWADAAINLPYGLGQKNFETLSMRAAVLDKMGRGEEATTAMKAALDAPDATPVQVHQYGRQLISQKKPKEALDVFLLNAKRNGDAWPVHVGLARGHSANGDLKQALEHAEKALAQAPDPVNKESLERMIETLKAGKPVEQ
jgi:hypothetical protein